MKRLASLLLALAWTAGPAAAQQAGESGHPAEAKNMALVGIRDPFNPREVASYIPATTPKTDTRCVKVNGVDRCKVAIQTNNVEVDDRGLIYIVDRATTGLHILELTGDARAIAKFP